MKFTHTRLSAAVAMSLLVICSAKAVPTNFTGAYTQNFDSIVAAGTGMPPGFRTMVTGSGSSVYTAASPITAAGIAAATASGTQTLTVWNAGSAVVSSATSLYNVGAWGNTSDRALGSDATSVAAMVMELSMTNKTGADLLGVTFSYDLKCLTNGTISSTPTGNEGSELPGYAFFYSTSGGTTAAEWARVDALSLTNSTQGTTMSSGTVTITFATPLTNNGIMYFRWADDNNVNASPDQMLAIDNIAINTSTNVAPTVAMTAPANGAVVGAGTNLTLSATAADANGTVAKVEFFSGATKLGTVTNAPYDFVWSNLALGSYSLTAKATDNDGVTTTSAAANLTVVPDLGTGGIYFDGVNDYVTFGAAPALGVSNFTVECWFKRTGTGATTTTGTGGLTATPLVTKGKSQSDASNVDCNFFLGFTNGTLAADFEDFNTGLNHPITGATAFTSNAWQHAAVTYSSSGTNGIWVLYLNGVPDATNAFTGTNTLVVTPRYDSIQHAGLGTAMDSTGTAAGFFNGKLDEVRIWNYARSAAQIAGARDLQIAAAPGLVGRWGLNETNGATAGDSAGSAVNGTLINGPLWVAGYPFPAQSNTAPVVAIGSPTNNAVFYAPANITVNVTASDAEGSVTNVEFFVNDVSAGVDTNAPFSLTLSNLAVGSYSLAVVANDNEGLSTTSSVVNISVNVPNLAPSVVSMNAPTNGETFVTNSPTLDVTVSDPEGTNLTVVFYGRVASPAPGADFTVIGLPDTQFYSETYSNVFFTQTDWVVSNRAALNIQYLAQLGDCVQNGDRGGTNDYEWRNATNALYRLENPLTTLLTEGIPYGVAVGNHDQGPTGNGIATDTSTFYNQYFGTNHFLPFGYYGGNFGTNNDNHYDLFSASGMDFIVIYFEYDTTLTSTNAAVLQWANNLLQANPNRRGIIVSHWIINSYTAGSTFGAQGQTIYNALKANTNLSLMLCGHINPNGEGRRSDTFGGRTVWTLLSDYQDLANGGNGWLRTYEFSPSNNIIRAKTYSPWLNQSQTGTNSQFEIPYPMSTQNAWVAIATNTGVASGGSATAVWNNLNSSTEYEWYVTVSDGVNTTTGPSSRFTTGTNTVFAAPTVRHDATVTTNATNFASQVAITPGASWKYLDNGTDQGTAWEAPAFNDATWTNGLAPLGYGDPWIVTTVFSPAAPNRYITTYFRKHFTAPTGVTWTNLSLGLLRDDGVVVYLNGGEVLRDNMPAGSIDYLTFAPLVIGGSDESTYFPFNESAAGVVPGDNMVAVELHQRDGTSSDLGFDLGLTLQGYTTTASGGGAVSNVTDHSATLLAEVTSDGGQTPDVIVFYGTTDGGTDTNLWQFRVNLGAQPIGKVSATVTGLVASTTYFFRYQATNEYGSGWAAASDSWTTLAASNTIPPQVTLTAPTNGAVFTVPANITLSANASDNGTVTNVEFFANGSKVGEDSTAPFSLVWSNVPLGSYALTAVATDNHGNTNISSAVNISVINPPTPNVVRGPYLQLSTPTSIVIRWRTDLVGSSRVIYGTSLSSLNFTNVDAAAVTNHEVTLTNLQPDTRYYYAIGTGAALHTTPGSNYFFLTHPLPGTQKPIRVWVIGDAGTGTANQRSVRDAFSNYNGTNPIHAWLQLGDNAYNSGFDNEYQANMFNIYSNILRNTVTWPTLGNHETDQATAFVDTYAHFQVFTLPTAGEAGGVPSGTEHYYSFDVGMVHFVCLDSMTASRATNGAMANWLRSDLAANTNHWLIAYWHHPPYTKGSHNSDTETELIEMRQNFNPILEAGGVDLILSGHSHCYERSYLIDGHYGMSGSFTNTMIVQSGSGRETNGVGAYLKPENYTGSPVGNRGAIYSVVGSSGQTSGGSLNHPAHFISLNNLGSMVVDITSNRLDAVFVRETGATNDWFTIRKDNYAPVANNAAVTIAADTSTNLILTGSDVNRNPLTFATNSLPTNGLIANFNPTNGTFTYTPVHGSTNGDALTFVANDGRTNSAAGLMTISVTPPADTNANFLPDVWEAAFSVSDPNGDDDGDGLSNLQEYIANTSPTNAASKLQITAATSEESGNFTITWASVGGTRYRVSYADNGATGPFTPIVRSVAAEMDSSPIGQAGTATFTDDLTLTGGAPTNGVRFYRVQVVR